MKAAWGMTIARNQANIKNIFSCVPFERKYDRFPLSCCLTVGVKAIQGFGSNFVKITPLKSGSRKSKTSKMAQNDTKI